MGKCRLAARGAVAALLTLITLLAAEAQQPPRRIRGTIETVDGSTLAIKTRDGTAISVRLEEKAVAVALVTATLADIKPGTYIGATGLPQTDGTLRAAEVHIFPESMRGAGEGHRSWDLAPDSTMTNGTAGQQVKSVEGSAIRIKYRDGEKTLTVTPETKIVAYQPGSLQDLKPGMGIYINAAMPATDGKLSASRINYGRDGVFPPM